MENAAKALQMAAGVLLSLMIVGIIVYTYNNISSVKQTEQSARATEAAADFNMKYEAYNRKGLYGSEILSLANLIVDYNEKEAENKGYEKIKIEIKSKEKITWSGDNSVKFEKTYTDGKALYNDYEKISKKIKELGKEKIDGKTIAQWYKEPKDTIGNVTISKKVNNYDELIGMQTEFARKTFDCTKVEYGTTGRINLMKFEEK